MASDAWQKNSFMVEIKPSNKYASVFMEYSSMKPNNPCPNFFAIETVSNALCVDEKSLGYFAKNDAVLDRNSESQIYIAYVNRIRFLPSTVCCISVDDQKGLVMFKVKVATDERTFISGFNSREQIALDISGNSLEDFLSDFFGDSIMLECRHCRALLSLKYPNTMKIVAVESDNFLETSPNMEYFCRDSCCHQVEHVSHPLDLVNGVLNEQWIPTESKTLISNSFFNLHINALEPHVVTIEPSSGTVRCSKCFHSLGKVWRTNSSILRCHITTTELKNCHNQKCFMTERFGSLQRFLTFLLLSQAESQSTTKLIIRDYERKPYLLIWLLEGYVLIMKGKLGPKLVGHDQNALEPFPALKMLYLIFDEKTANSDPRANGKDSSVGIVELPGSCCRNLAEILTASSSELPPVYQSMAQFSMCLEYMHDESLQLKSYRHPFLGRFLKLYAANSKEPLKLPRMRKRSS